MFFCSDVCTHQEIELVRRNIMFSKKILSRADDKSGAKTLAKDQDKLMGKLIKKLKK